MVLPWLLGTAAARLRLRGKPSGEILQSSEVNGSSVFDRDLSCMTCGMTYFQSQSKVLHQALS